MSTRRESSSVVTKGDSGKRCSRKPAAAPRACGSPRPSTLAQQRAAAVLEVLAGVCTPPEAATILNVSVNGYYLLERKALAGLTAACEPKPKGRRVPGAERKLVALEGEVQRLRRECLRQSALVRATQRAVGLPATAAKPAAKEATTGGKRKRRRRATVRALRAAESLRKTALGPHAAAGVEQRSAEIRFLANVSGPSIGLPALRAVFKMPRAVLEDLLLRYRRVWRRRYRRKGYRLGFRGAVRVLRVFFAWLGVEQAIPGRTTIRNWFQRLGVDELKQPFDCQKSLVLMVDHSSQIGPEKVREPQWLGLSLPKQQTER